MSKRVTPETAEDWPAERIKSLRARTGLNQTQFGLLCFAYGEHSAQTAVSRLERGKVKPSAALVRTLQRLESGEIKP